MSASNRITTSIEETILVAGEHVQHKTNTQQAKTDKQYVDPQAWKKSLQQVMKQHNAVIEALKYR